MVLAVLGEVDAASLEDAMGEEGEDVVEGGEEVGGVLTKVLQQKLLVSFCFVSITCR